MYMQKQIMIKFNFSTSHILCKINKTKQLERSEGWEKAKTSCILLKLGQRRQIRKNIRVIMELIYMSWLKIKMYS